MNLEELENKLKKPMVYVAHPFGGEEENREKAELIIRELHVLHPQITFVSPLHAFCLPYDKGAEYQAMAYCFNLLSRCDALLLSGYWSESNGCFVELEYALDNEIPIITKWGKK